MGKFAANVILVLLAGIFRVFAFHLKHKDVHKLFGLKAIMLDFRLKFSKFHMSFKSPISCCITVIQPFSCIGGRAVSCKALWGELLTTRNSSLGQRAGTLYLAATWPLDTMFNGMEHI